MKLIGQLFSFAAIIGAIEFACNPKAAMESVYQTIKTPAPHFYVNTHRKRKHKSKPEVSGLPTEAQLAQWKEEGLETLRRIQIQNEASR